MTDFTIGSVTLPQPPKEATRDDQASIQSEAAGSITVVISLGKNPDKLLCEGYIWEEGKTSDQLDTDYLVPLRALEHTEVAITYGTSSRYNGNWIFSRFTVTESNRFYNAFYVKMEFVKGTLHVVI